MNGFWNPYLHPCDSQRRIIGGVSILLLLLVWSILSGSGLVSPARLPAPWDVLKAMAYLSWYEGESLLLTAIIWSGAVAGGRNPCDRNWHTRRNCNGCIPQDQCSHISSH